MGEARIDLGGLDDVSALRELWLELHHHHAAVGAATGAFTDDESSWRVRSASYREWLAEPDSFLLLARDDDGIVGYAVVRVMDAGPEWTDTWRMPDRIAELETLMVAARARGDGLGTRMLDVIDDELAARGIDEVIVGLIPGNDGAMRLYERRGFRPRWIVLARPAS